MPRRKDNLIAHPSRPVPAGNFSAWLHDTAASLQTGNALQPANSSAHVPCGTCRGCCRSSMFIHIKPHETRTLQRIPRALRFPAPGLPKGHVLLGYDEHGQCPMFVDNQCSIYEDRPQTCRDYDCRIFAATGLSVDLRTQAEIADRVKAWVFIYESEDSREEHRLVLEAAAFLERNKDLFPPGAIPTYPVQLAALAVRVYRVFAAMTAPDLTGKDSDADIAHAIVRALRDS